MLVTLLVLWVVVVPALTIAGTYVLSAILGHRLRARREHAIGLAVAPVRPAPVLHHRSQVRGRARAKRSHDHAPAGR